MNAVLIKRPENKYRLLTHTEFNLLILCDGVTNLSEIPLSAEETSLLAGFLTDNIVVKAENPTPLQETQMYHLYPNRFVQSVMWSVTGRCNFRCRHCYMDAPNGAFGEISHKEAMALVDQMADCGVLHVDFTGGEPFVRKDFWELVDRILSHKMTIGQVYTNGWLLTEEVLDAFENRGIRPEISISFDCLGWHDWMRGVNGAEEAALKALSLCVQRGFPVNVEVCVHKGNLGTLRDTLNRLAQIGVPLVRIGNVANTDLWQKNSQGNNMTYEEYVDAILDYIPDFFADGMPVNLLIGGVVFLNKGSTEYRIVPEHFVGNEGSLNCYLCGAARSSCYITPEGRLLPCMPMTACKEQDQFPRFQDIGLRAGLSGSFYMQFVDKRVKDLIAVNEKCAACPHVLKCGGGCRASALSASGNLFGEDPDLCFMWENGYVEKIHQAADEAIAKYCNS